MHNTLTPEMQARLDAWRKGAPVAGDTEKLRGKFTPSYVARVGDFDDEDPKEQKKENYGATRK